MLMWVCWRDLWSALWSLERTASPKISSDNSSHSFLCFKFQARPWHRLEQYDTWRQPGQAAKSSFTQVRSWNPQQYVVIKILLLSFCLLNNAQFNKFFHLCTAKGRRAGPANVGKSPPTREMYTHWRLRSCTANTLAKFQVLDERRPAFGKIAEMQMI